MEDFEQNILLKSCDGGGRSVRGLVVMIVACQVTDPGSIPERRNPTAGQYYCSTRSKFFGATVCVV